MTALTEELREKIKAEFSKYPPENRRAVTLPALHIVQDAQRCVSTQAVREIAALLELHPAEVFDTLSFYGFYRDEHAPLGRHRLWVCRSISCALRGGEELLKEVAADLGVKPGETTPDGNVTLEFAECLGACEGAPCVLLDDECHMNVDAARVKRIVQERK